MPGAGPWRERLNSDAAPYGGSGMGNSGEVRTDDIPHHGHPHSLSLVVPPLGFLLLEPRSQADAVSSGSGHDQRASDRRTP